MIRVPSTEEKIKAITDTVSVVAEHLQTQGKIAAFKDFSKDDICGLIRACSEGVQASLRDQLGATFEDEIPF